MARKKAKYEVAEKLLALQLASEDLTHKEKYASKAQINLIRNATATMPWLNENMIKCQVKRLKKKRKMEQKETEINAILNGYVETEMVNHGGRPKGSTNEAKKSRAEREKNAKLDIEARIKAERYKHNHKRLPVGMYKSIHDSVIAENGLSDDQFSVSRSTIDDRIRHSRLEAPGQVSVAAAIEPIIATYAKQRQEAGQPMKPSEVLTFANSIIQGSELEKSIKNFFQLRNRSVPENLLGKGWYKGFMNRNKDMLVSAKGGRMHLARREWTTYNNMQTMYELVYEQMVEAGIASHLPEEEHYWVDRSGNRVNSEEEAIGHKCSMKLDHPDWLLFGDEVGTDTAQDSDGHIGGQTYLSFAGKRIELNSSKATNRFTVMGLTAATGDPVMCIVIMSGHELGVADSLGFDHQARYPYDSTKSLEENRGKDKALPGLPSCFFRGKEIPGLLACTPKGSMTSEILQQIHKRLDDLNVFPRTPIGPTPMVLYDGHDSRLQVEFLSYVNKPNEFGNPMWKACIGLPNGTAKWQVGDSQEQNASWKMAMTREKDRLVQYKTRHLFSSLDFKRHDVIPLVNKAWKASFERKKQNLQAIMDRGWFHLDMRLLKDKEVLATKVSVDQEGSIPQEITVSPPTSIHADSSSNSSIASDVTPDSFSGLLHNLNFTSGLAGEFTLDLLQHLKRSMGVHQAHLKRKADAEATQQRFDDFMKDQRLTAGVIFKYNKVVLDGDILSYRKAKEDQNQQQKVDALKTIILRYKKRLAEYQETTTTTQNRSTNTYTVTELKRLISVRKMKADGPMPSTKAKLLKFYLLLRHRQPLTLQQCLVDEGKESRELDTLLSKAQQQMEQQQQSTPLTDTPQLSNGVAVQSPPLSVHDDCAAAVEQTAEL